MRIADPLPNEVRPYGFERAADAAKQVRENLTSDLRRRRSGIPHGPSGTRSIPYGSPFCFW